MHLPEAQPILAFVEVLELSLYVYYYVIISAEYTGVVPAENTLDS